MAFHSASTQIQSVCGVCFCSALTAVTLLCGQLLVVVLDVEPALASVASVPQLQVLH